MLRQQLLHHSHKLTISSGMQMQCSYCRDWWNNETVLLLMTHYIHVFRNGWMHHISTVMSSSVVIFNTIFNLVLDVGLCAVSILPAA